MQNMDNKQTAGPRCSDPAQAPEGPTVSQGHEAPLGQAEDLLFPKNIPKKHATAPWLGFVLKAFHCPFLTDLRGKSKGRVDLTELST